MIVGTRWLTRNIETVSGQGCGLEARAASDRRLGSARLTVLP